MDKKEAIQAEIHYLEDQRAKWLELQDRVENEQAKQAIGQYVCWLTMDIVLLKKEYLAAKYTTYAR